MRRFLLGDRGLDGTGKSSGSFRKLQLCILSCQLPAWRAAKGAGFTVSFLIQYQRSGACCRWLGNQGQAVGECFGWQITYQEARTNLRNGSRLARGLDTRTTGQNLE